MKFTQDKNHPIFTEFPQYLAEWKKLEQEYYRIPSWRIFKQLQNIRKREKLTKAYSARMIEWGII